MWKKAIAIGLLLKGSVAFAAPGRAEEVSRGRDLAERRCASCHAIGDTDASPNPLPPPYRSLYRQYPVDTLQPALLKGLPGAHPGLPGFLLKFGRRAGRARDSQTVQILGGGGY